MSKLSHSGHYALMDSCCKQCAEDANLVWPADTKGYWSGLCQSCGEREGTLVPFDDMKEAA